MNLNFSFGKRFGEGGLTRDQRAVLDRLERGEITADEAERLLSGGATVRERLLTAGEAATKPEAAEPGVIEETEEEAKARELVERIAREVDDEMLR